MRVGGQKQGVSGDPHPAPSCSRDNADALDEHHEHAHTRSGGKHEAAILPFDSSDEAMSAAIDKAKAEGEEMVRQWRLS